VRAYQNRPGVSVNLAQQVTDTVGVFGRAGLADGNVEPWDNTDCDRTVEAGVSLNGKPWKRPDDRIGIGGVINGISAIHAAYFNDGGVGIVIGDGKLPHYGPEEIIETYYKYAISAHMEISLDYQCIRNPSYNTQRGPVNVFGGRFHFHF
jgi:high affinity Mn2+ porin